MTLIHMTVGRGGVGKTFVSTLLAQYLLDSGHKVLCLDSDYQNQPMVAFATFGARSLDVREVGALRQALEQAQAGQQVLLDQGPGSQMTIPAEAAGREDLLTVHALVTADGMQAQLMELHQVLAGTPGVRCILWLNPIAGPINDLEKCAGYKLLRSRLLGILVLPSPLGLFARDLVAMLARGWTFREALCEPSLQLLTRQRLTMLRRKLYAGIEVTGAGQSWA